MTTSTSQLFGGEERDMRRSSAGVRRWAVPHRSTIACLAGLMLAGAASAQPRETWKGQPDSVNGLALSPDGKTLASYTVEGTITLWDLAAKKKTATLISDQARGESVDFTPDGKSLVAVGVRMRANKGEHPMGSYLYSAKIWDLATQKVRLTIDLPEGGAAGGLITPDGKFLICGGLKTGVVQYDLVTGKPSEPLGLDKEYWDVRALALAPDGKALAVGVRSGAILLWDLDKKAARWTVPPDGERFPQVLAFSPDGKTLAAGSYSHRTVVSLWDVAGGKLTATLDFEPRVNIIRVLAFAPDGKTIAVGGNFIGISLADIAAGGERDDFEGDFRTSLVCCLVFTPDGKTLISGGTDHDKDKAIWFWDVPQGKPKGLKPVGEWTRQEAKQLVFCHAWNEG